ncbi:MAG: hypothetical protein N2513_09440 [Deltaproteobacteria bacterium]|nr:hypothetical protein [Deltaproteobacteria bacterium]
MNKPVEQLYNEREQRVLDAIALKKPDRVPILPLVGFFPERYAGVAIQETLYDPDKLWEVSWKFLLDFEPDMDRNPYAMRLLGPILETLDYKQLLWAGHGLSRDVTFQFVEGEYMNAGEYDSFLFDPTDFMLRSYWPRVFGNLKGFEKLPPMRDIINYSMGLPFGFIPFQIGEIIESFNVLRIVGEKASEIASYAQLYAIKSKEAGFPSMFGGLTHAPFDALGDYFRGTKGLMLDMYRRPEKVVAACEKLLPIMIEIAINAFKMSGNPRIFIPLHKGMDKFMSVEQFKKFYWPTLKELIVTLIKEGLTPCLFWEGDCTSRLGLIGDIPAGKAIYAFESSDIFKAKEILGDKVCIRGNVPVSILATGTSEDVKAYCKRLIDFVGKDGGYIMDSSANFEDAKVENVKAMFDFTKEYGVY